MKDPAENDRFLEIAIPIAKMIDKEKDIRIKRIDSIAKHLKWLEENQEVLNDPRNPCQFHNISLCASNEKASAIKEYKNLNNITNDVSVYLVTSIFTNYSIITEEAWNLLRLYTHLDEYILPIMDYYDPMRNHFDGIIIVNRKFNLTISFPVLGDQLIVEQFDIDERSIDIIPYQYKIPYIDGMIIATINKNEPLYRFLDNLQGKFHIKIITSENVVLYEKQYYQDQECECQLQSLINSSNQKCDTPQMIQENYYTSGSCQKLYLQRVLSEFQKSTLAVYIVIYTASVSANDSFSVDLQFHWASFTILSLLVLILTLVLNKRIDKYTRDITNPISQITEKLNKINKNVFVPKILNKVSGDDILIREETEVKKLANDFSQLFLQLKEQEIFSNELTTQIDQSYSKSKEILLRKPDKSLEQVKSIVQKFCKEN